MEAIYCGVMRSILFFVVIRTEFQSNDRLFCVGSQRNRSSVCQGPVISVVLYAVSKGLQLAGCGWCEIELQGEDLIDFLVQVI